MTTSCINNILSDSLKDFQNSTKTPKKVDWRVFNTQKELVPLSKAGKVFF